MIAYHGLLSNKDKDILTQQFNIKKELSSFKTFELLLLSRFKVVNKSFS